MKQGLSRRLKWTLLFAGSVVAVTYWAYISALPIETAAIWATAKFDAAAANQCFDRSRYATKPSDEASDDSFAYFVWQELENPSKGIQVSVQRSMGSKVRIGYIDRTEKDFKYKRFFVVEGGCKF
jgi:hypothetical protein